MIITNKENHYNRQLSNHENYEIVSIDQLSLIYVEKSTSMLNGSMDE